MYNGVGTQRTSTFILGTGITSGTVITPPTGQRIICNGFSLSTVTGGALVSVQTYTYDDTKARFQADAQGLFPIAYGVEGYYLPTNESIRIWGDGSIIYGNLFWEERK